MNPEETKRSKLTTKLMIVAVILVFFRLTAYVVDTWDFVEKGFNEGRTAAGK
jgi:hypothetical protein